MSLGRGEHAQKCPHGVQLGAYDRQILHWLAGQELPTTATVISLLWRARQAAAHQGRWGGGETR